MTRVEVVREQLIQEDRYKGDNKIMETCPNAHRVGPSIDGDTFYMHDDGYNARRSGCRGITCFECWNRSITIGPLN